MERRRVIATLAGGLAIAVALAACTDREPRTVALARDCTAPYYDYYYYPEKNVYFHVLTGFYYYYYDGHWGRSYVLPGDIRLNHRRRQTIVYRFEYPYEKNDDHRRQFGFPSDPRILPVQASVGKSQGQPPPPIHAQYVAIACNPAAPPYDYYYYPEHNVYFHVSTGYYYYYHDGYWRHAFILPFHIIIDHRHRQTIVYRDKYPFEKNHDHRRQFGYQPDPRILPAQAGGGGNQGIGQGIGRGQPLPPSQTRGGGQDQPKAPQVQPKAAQSATPQTQPKAAQSATPQTQPKAAQSATPQAQPKPSTPKPTTPKPAGKAPKCEPGTGQGKGCK